MSDARTPLPPLPSLRALTAELRELHKAQAVDRWRGDSHVHLVCEVQTVKPFRAWGVTESHYLDHPSRVYVWLGTTKDTRCVYGREHIPGDGAPFDAVAAARRLLAAARDAGPQICKRL